MVDIDIYYPEKERSAKRFNKLYLDSFNKLGFYNRALGNGLISVNDTVNFEINVADYFQNNSTVKGQILPGKINTVKLNQAAVLNENAYLKLIVPNNIKKLQFSSGKSPDSLGEITYYEIIDRTVQTTESILFLKIRLAEKGDFIIQSFIENRFGQVLKTNAIIDAKNSNKIKVNSELYGKNLFLSFENIIDSESLQLSILTAQTKKDIRLNISNNYAEYIFPAKNFQSKPIKLTLHDLHKQYFDTTIAVNLLVPNQKQNFSFNNDSLLLASTANTVYDTLYFSLIKEAINPEGMELPVYGSSYKMSIGDQILNRSINLKLKSDSSFFPDGQAAIFALTKKD